MELRKKGAFSVVWAWLYSFEYQRRGLPPALIIPWLTPNNIKPEEIDMVISAEIPNKEADLELHSIVIAQMTHSPCGAINPRSPCMNDGKCRKDDPKAFLQCTEQGVDSYPKYCHDSYRSRCNRSQTSGWCPTIHSNYHINVEICSSINSNEYVLKYLTKGMDQAVLELQQTEEGEIKVVDEITQFQIAHYAAAVR